MKPKPIFVVTLINAPHDEWKIARDTISKELYDYHVLVLNINDDGKEYGATFELFSVNNATEIELEELKQRIKPYLDEVRDTSTT